MDIHTALLADSATVREGLLHLLGAPITRMWTPELPLPLTASVALVIDLAPDEWSVPHEIHTNLTGPDDEPVAQIMGALVVQAPPRIEAGEHLLVPAVASLLGILLERYGEYHLEVSCDAVARRTLHFYVLDPVELSLPPI